VNEACPECIPLWLVAVLAFGLLWLAMFVGIWAASATKLVDAERAAYLKETMWPITVVLVVVLAYVIWVVR
jgi:hypothetical protein